MTKQKRGIISASNGMSGKDALELLEKTGEQYRVYRELHDIAKLAQDSVLSAPVAPSAEYPLSVTLTARK